MTLSSINKWITDSFGKDLYGNPNYRVVWSTNEFEKRYGTFEDYQGDIYLRTVTETREVPKYPLYQNFFVFEKIQPNVANSELKATLSYEPIWVFRNKAGKMVEPERWAVEVIVQADRAIKKMRLSPSDIEAAEELRMAREKMRYKMMLQNESPITATLVHNGAGIFVPSTYEKSK